MNKPEIKSIRLLLTEGQTSVEESLNINPGEMIFAAATTEGAHSRLLRIGMDVNGNEIHAPLAAGFWDGQIGTFQQRGRLLATKGGVTVDVKVQTSTAIAAGNSVEIEVAFEIWKQGEYRTTPDGTVIPGSC